MARGGGGLGKQAAGHVDGLLDRGWNLLLYPEGTRSRNGGTGRLRRGAAVLAARHHVLIVPIRVSRETEVQGADIPEMGALAYPDFELKTTQSVSDVAVMASK